MILDILVFTLGFLIATLLALALLPAVWRRALRISSERLSRLVPLSADEVGAERDHLRATHAVDVRRAEQRLERAEAARAGEMAERSRLADRIVDLDAENARSQVEIARLEAEGAGLARDRDHLQAESGATAIALEGAFALAERRWLEIATAEADRQRLEQQIDQDRGTVAGLETRVLGLSGRNSDLEREIDKARAAASTASERAAAAEVERAALQTAIAAREKEADALNAELALARERAAASEKRAADLTVSLAAGATDPTRTSDAHPPAPAADMPQPSGDEFDRLRAVIRTLADDVLRVTGAAKASVEAP